MLVYFLIGLLAACIVGAVAGSRGRSGFGWFLYGLLLWPLALIHVLVLPKRAEVLERRQLALGEARKCPHCAEIVRPEARVCRFCGRDLEPGAIVV